MMKQAGLFCMVISIALPLLLDAESVSNGKAVLELKDGVIELRAGDGNSGIFSVLVFKEKMKWWQYVGIALGIIAVGILNIG